MNENEHVIAFLDLFSINEGHTLVVPKTHATHLNNLDADVSMRVFAAAHKLAQWIRDFGIRCEGVNLLLKIPVDMRTVPAIGRVNRYVPRARLAGIHHQDHGLLPPPIFKQMKDMKA